MGDAEVLPLRDVVVRNVRVLRRIGGVASQASDVGHGSDADNALEC